MDAALIEIEKFVKARTDKSAPFRALIGAHAGGMASLQTLDDDTAGTELYARLPGFVNGRVGDEVMCLMVNGKPFILGVVQRSAAVPTLVVGGAAGTGASGQFLGADDISGVVEVTGGTGAVAGSVLAITFAVPKSTASYDVTLTAYTSATEALGGRYNVTGVTTAKFDIRAGIALTNASIYRWSYQVREHAAP